MGAVWVWSGVEKNPENAGVVEAMEALRTTKSPIVLLLGPEDHLYERW